MENLPSAAVVVEIFVPFTVTVAPVKDTSFIVVYCSGDSFCLGESSGKDGKYAYKT
ncbi:hypothetical protein ACQ86N_47165 [Puia sp. P3]|uniref:hypothetical protein n=1 Tax=Puia sp. P3 TaxID=3423952 RepID=UPI003D67389B